MNSQENFVMVVCVVVQKKPELHFIFSISSDIINSMEHYLHHADTLDRNNNDGNNNEEEVAACTNYANLKMFNQCNYFTIIIIIIMRRPTVKTFYFPKMQSPHRRHQLIKLNSMTTFA